MPRFVRRVPATAPTKVRNPFTLEVRILPGTPEGLKTVEITQDGASVTETRSKPDKSGRPRRRAFSSEAAARGHLARRIRSLRGQEYLEQGEAPPPRASSLLFEELLEAGDPRLLAEIGGVSGKKLIAIADRWFADERPAVRAMLLEHVRAGCERPESKPFFKRLLALADKRGDDALMGAFAVAFDRLEKRWLVEHTRFSWEARAEVTEPALVTAPQLPSATGDRASTSAFSRATRQHLCRRAFRYFRRLAYREPQRYARGLALALVHFTDADLGAPDRFLDCWSLLHALYWGSDVLVRDPRGIRVAAGKSLADLAFAPLKPEAWQQSFEVTLEMAVAARARPVARFALHLLERHHADRFRAMPFATAQRLLGATHEVARAFMVARLGEVADLDKVTVSDWMALLDGSSLETAPEIARHFRAHVAARRVSLEEAVTLSLSPIASVAELGLDWAKELASKGLTALQRQRLLRMVTGRAPLVRHAAAAYLADLLRQAPEARPEEVRELFDAADVEVRARGLSLVGEVPRFAASPVVWAAMAESPYPEVRERLLDELQRFGDRAADRAARRQAPQRHGEAPPPVARPRGTELVDDVALARLWSTTLLSIHCGGRAKPRALTTMAQALERDPSRAEAVVPLLRLALRSVRATERRAALAAVVRAAQASAEVRGAVQRHLPELDLGPLDTEVFA